jgi:nitrogen regulatory protein PII-like uncharacterized protein
MAISIQPKQIGQWVVGIITTIFLGSIKLSLDNYSKHNDELKEKVDKVYDYATNHEVRMKIVEEELADHSKRILDLQLAQERLGVEDFNQVRKKNRTSVSSK